MTSAWAEIRSYAYPTLDRHYVVSDDASTEHLGDAAALIAIVYGLVKVEASLIKEIEMQQDIRRTQPEQQPQFGSL
jgi:hypothetical protein